MMLENLWESYVNTTACSMRCDQSIRSRKPSKTREDLQHRPIPQHQQFDGMAEITTNPLRREQCYVDDIDDEKHSGFVA